jgi:proteasome lid subunit RPN8/RPN11
MADDEYTIVVYPEQVELNLQEKIPPLRNSDVWPCLINTKPLALTVFMHNRAKRTILLHASSTPNIEVGGVLIGDIYSHRYAGNQAPNTIIEITGGVSGDFTEGNSVSLTFTPDTWSKILRDVEAQHPDKRILGWYHTHPGHGIFLSGPDKFIQNNFFGHSYLLALVVDPIRKRAGFFVGAEHDPAGIQQSDEFTWDDNLYQLQPGMEPKGKPRIQQLSSPPYPVAEVPKARVTQPDHVSAVSYNPEHSSRPGSSVQPEHQDDGETQRRRPAAYIFSLFGRRQQKSKPQQGMPDKYHEPVLRIDTGDLQRPEVQHLMEQQERSRMQQQQYINGYPGVNSASQGQGRRGCFLLALAAPILCVGILSLRLSLLPTLGQSALVDNSLILILVLLMLGAVSCILIYLLMERFFSSTRED